MSWDEHLIVSNGASVSGAHRQFEAEDLRARACRLHHGRGEPWPPAPGDRKHAPWRFFGCGENPRVGLQVVKFGIFHRLLSKLERFWGVWWILRSILRWNIAENKIINTISWVFDHPKHVRWRMYGVRQSKSNMNTMSLSWMAVSSPQKNTMDGSAIQRLGPAWKHGWNMGCIHCSKVCYGLMCWLMLGFGGHLSGFQNHSILLCTKSNESAQS